jgi:hypothetical protein
MSTYVEYPSYDFIDELSDNDCLDELSDNDDASYFGHLSKVCGLTAMILIFTNLVSMCII